jgi:hypothetical protein
MQSVISFLRNLSVHVDNHGRLCSLLHPSLILCRQHATDAVVASEWLCFLRNLSVTPSTRSKLLPFLADVIGLTRVTARCCQWLLVYAALVCACASNVCSCMCVRYMCMCIGTLGACLACMQSSTVCVCMCVFVCVWLFVWLSEHIYEFSCMHKTRSRRSTASCGCATCR